MRRWDRLLDIYMEARLLNAALIGKVVPDASQKVAKALVECASTSVKQLLGPVLARTF